MGHLNLTSFVQPVIYGNLASSMRVVVSNMENLGIPFSSPANRVRARTNLEEVEAN